MPEMRDAWPIEATPITQEKNDVNDSYQGAMVEAAQRRRRLVMNAAQSTRAEQP